VANYPNAPNKIWINDGRGIFVDSGLALGNYSSHGVNLQDLDGDGDLDAFVANYNGQGNRVWLNNGYILTVDATGNGTVTGTGIDCPGDCSEHYDYGTAVDLTATPDAGYIAIWTGCDSVIGNVCTLTMDKYVKKITTKFVKAYQININIMPDGGGVIQSSGINCPDDCTEIYPEGSEIILTPISSKGFVFEGWHVGSCIGVSPCHLTVNSDLQINAKFFSKPTVLTLPPTILNGNSVIMKCDINPNGLNTKVWIEWGIISFNEHITTLKDIGNGFVNVLIEEQVDGILPGVNYKYRCVGLNSMGYTYGDAQILQTTFLLDISKHGFGTVNSTPSGIDCGTTCSAQFDSGTDVTLNITPDPGNIATIKVDGVIVGTGTSYTFNALSADHTVEVIFSPNEYVFYESFADGIPLDWTVNDGGSTADTWSDTDTCGNGSSFITNVFTAPWVIVDSDCAGAVGMDEELITPSVDAGSCSQVIVEFSNQFHAVTGNEVGDFDVSIDGGTTWVNVLSLVGKDDGYDYPNTKRIDITSEAAGQTDVMLRWHYYNANGGGWWAIDNVGVICNATEEMMVLMPNGMEHIPSGGTHTITWTAPSGAVSFDLEYSINDGNTWRSIATGVGGTSYDWSVPAVAGNKRKCLVRVTGYDSIGNIVGSDTSDSRFMIEVIKITAPNGGETYSPGDTVPIVWTTNATKTPIDKVVIKYHLIGDTGWNLIDVIKGGNPGTYNWVIPSGFTAGQYRLKVNLWDANKNRRGADKSDGVFTVQ